MGAPIPDYQRHRIASCAAVGYPIERISVATGLPTETIKRQLDDPTESMRQLIDHYRFQQNGMLVKFKMETARLVDDGLKIVERTLRQEKDPRLAYETAKDILSAHGCIFPRDRASAPQVNTQLNIYADNRTVQAMEQVSNSIKESTEALRGSLPKASSILDGQHIHVSQAEIISTPKPASVPDSSTIELDSADELQSPPKGNGSGNSS